MRTDIVIHTRLTAPDEQRLRRDVVTLLVRRHGLLRLTRGLARRLGVTRKALVAEAGRMIDDGEPMRWAAPRLLARADGVTDLHLALNDRELETLVAALRHVKDGSHTRRMVVEAAHLLHRIAASLPADRFEALRALGGFDVLPKAVDAEGHPTTRMANLVTEAILGWRKLAMLYTDAQGARTDRTVWPVTFALHGSSMVAWCETRNDFRTFRLARMADVRLLDAAVPRSREALLHDWRARMPPREGEDGDDEEEIRPPL